MVISVNGRSTELIVIQTGENYVFHCKAIGSKPAVELIWKIDGLVLDINTTFFTDTMGDGTFLSTSSFEYFPSTIPRNISCSSSGQQSIGAIIVAAEFVPYGKPMYNLFH